MARARRCIVRIAALISAATLLLLTAPAAVPTQQCAAQMPCDWNQLCDANNPCKFGCTCTYPVPGRLGYCR